MEVFDYSSIDYSDPKQAELGNIYFGIRLNMLEFLSPEECADRYQNFTRITYCELKVFGSDPVMKSDIERFILPIIELD
jgi:hypothetical protein